MFHGTRSNLAWARSDAGEEEMWQVLRMAAAEELIRKLPSGLDTISAIAARYFRMANDNGSRSRERCCASPACWSWMRRPTASMKKTRRACSQALDNLHGNLTIVLIAHRFSTIKRADIVYVIDQGRIVDSATGDNSATRR